MSRYKPEVASSSRSPFRSPARKLYQTDRQLSRQILQRSRSRQRSRQRQRTEIERSILVQRERERQAIHRQAALTRQTLLHREATQAHRNAVAIQEELRYKSAVKVEHQIRERDRDLRRIADQNAILQVKSRHAHELQDRVQSLIRQNNQLARDNDELARQLSERRYQLERIRISAAENHDRQALRSGQLFQANKSLQLQIQLSKKQKAQSTRSFQQHILNLQRLLNQKVTQLDSLTIRYNDLSKQLELATIQFQEQRNHLKNLMTRTEHELQRELTYTKQRQTSEKFSQIDALKRNHNAQLILLQDQIAKLKNLNTIKTQQFQAQLLQNKNLRRRHDEEVRLLTAENDQIRGRMLKLEQINRSEVENIQNKYSDYHVQGTSSLKQQHGRQIKLLLDEIDKQKWLINQKNIQIQNLVQDKRDCKRQLDQTQLQLSSQIDSLKNKLVTQFQRSSKQNHDLMAKINQTILKSLSDSEGYHQRVVQFSDKIKRLQSEINEKSNTIDKNKRASDIRQKQYRNEISNLNFSLQKARRQFSDKQHQYRQLHQEFNNHKTKTQSQLKNLHAQLNETQVKLQQAEDKVKSQGDDHTDAQQILRIQIQALKSTISVLQEKLSEQQTNHANQMSEFSANLNQKLKKLQVSQRNSLDQLQKSKNELASALNLRIQKLTRDLQYAESELKRYIGMYTDLQKYFKNPHEGSLFQQKSNNSIYQVLQKVQKSNIHVF